MSSEDFTAYVEAAWSRLFRTAYALTGDVAAADDLLQVTLVKMYRNWRSVRSAEAPDAYVRRIMVNEAASRWRAGGRRRELLSADPGRHVEASTGFETDLVESDELWSRVQQLPARQRAVVVLRYYEDLSEREIADVLGVAPGTVKSLASAAMAKLRGWVVPVESSTGGNR